MQAMVAGPAYDRRPIFTDIGTEKSSWALRSIYDKSTSSDIRSALQEVREPDRPPSNQLTMLNDLTKEHAQAFIGILTGAASVGTGTGTGTGTESGTESGVEVLLGEGYVADIKLTNVPISKLQELLDKKLAKAFYKKVEWSYKPYSSTPSKVMTIETQDLAKAEIGRRS